MVDPQSLAEGQPYFLVLFRDEALRIPVIMTMLFVWSGMDEGEPAFLFQRADDDCETGRIGMSMEELGELVFDRAGLITLLQSHG
jgi:hypothetical protein